MLMALISLKTIDDMMFEELCSALNQHFRVSPLPLAKYFEFFAARQDPNQSHADNVIQLCTFAALCSWAISLNRALAIEFVMGNSTTPPSDLTPSNHYPGTLPSKRSLTDHPYPSHYSPTNCHPTMTTPLPSHWPFNNSLVRDLCKPPLKKSSAICKSFTQQKTGIRGQAAVHVNYKGKSTLLQLLVVENGNSGLGRGKFWLCANFLISLNDSLDIHQYLLPHLADLFHHLNGRKIFSKIDFSDAYLQLKLDNKSKKIVVISTHKGLFQYNRLPFGIMSALTLFQQVIEQMLAGIPGVGMYLNDVIVTAANETTYLQQLRQVPARILDYSFRVRKKSVNGRNRGSTTSAS
uniref:Reverse transcriptase domain-containing protein n=1 Tax=Plectus sambesii TaxID=2011161 RepID=A0A914WHS6_9BILA